METINKNVTDILLLFKTKIQEAIYLIENMPDDTRKDVWQFWKEVSKIVKVTTRQRSTKGKQKALQIKQEPDTGVMPQDELELSVLHLQEQNEDHESDNQDDSKEVSLPITFSQDLDKENTFDYTPDLQLLYNSVYNSESSGLAVCSSNVTSISADSGKTAVETLYSSKAVCSAISSSKEAEKISSETNVSGEATPAENHSSEIHKTETLPETNSHSVYESEDITELREVSTSVLESVSDTCELYATNGSDAVLVSKEIQIQEPPKRRRGRPRKASVSDDSETHVIKSLPSTGMKILSIRPKRIKKVKESSIYCYTDSQNRKYNSEDNYEQDSSYLDNNDHSYNESYSDRGEVGDKENEEEEETTSRRRKRRSRNGSTYDQGPVICPECGVQLAYSSSLIAHMRKHTGARPFKCQTCAKGFTTKANMLRHELTHTGERPFQCTQCDKAFTEAKSLAVHIRTHTGEKPYVCKICNASFRQRGTLQAHIYCHTGHKGHLCDICGKAFRQKTQLREHQKRHTKSKSVKCEVCGKMFYGKGELFRHSLQHSGLRPYKCTLCEKTFTRQQYLREHTNIHTGNKPHVCRECSAAFYDLASLYRHQLKHKLQAKKTEAKPTDIKTELFGSEVVIVNKCASDEDLQNLIVAAAENGQLQISHSTGNQLQAAAQSIMDDASSPVAQVYQITYVDPDNGDVEGSARSENGQILTSVDFSAINLLAKATQLSLSQ